MFLKIGNPETSSAHSHMLVRAFAVKMCKGIVYILMTADRLISLVRSAS